MAKNTTIQAFEAIMKDIRAGVFSRIYLLMGEEQFYIDRIYSALVSTVLDESERDFNQMVYYGQDVTGALIAETASRYPMMAERQLVAVREAQAVKKIEDMLPYVKSPLESTVLVLCYMGKTMDKRSALYKAIAASGTVFESSPVKDYEMPAWIASYFKSQNLEIEPDAANLLAEYAGNDLSKIALEADKLQKGRPDGAKTVTVKDIEDNVGISRQFSVFELTKTLSYRKTADAFRIAAYMGRAPKFALAAAIVPIFTHYFRILKYHALKQSDPSISSAELAKSLGVNPYFLAEYDTAARNYPLKKCMSAISLIKEYDFKSKGGDCGEATQGELLTELVSRLLSV